MQKQTKIIIGVGIGVLALSVFLSAKANAMNKKNNNVSTLPPATTDISTTGGARCPTGEIPCSNNPSKCYNPSIDYFVNPCN
jgi:hypothetical protein